MCSEKCFDSPWESKALMEATKANRFDVLTLQRWNRKLLRISLLNYASVVNWGCFKFPSGYYASVFMMQYLIKFKKKARFVANFSYGH